MAGGIYLEDIKNHLQNAVDQEMYPYGIEAGSVGPALLWEINNLMINNKSMEDACKEILGSQRCVYPTPGTIREAFTLAEKNIASEKGIKGNLNLSSIATILIQNVGRFSESFASDFLIDWDTLRRVVDKSEPGDDSIVVFGIRKGGVDHTQFLMNRLQPANINTYIDAERYYRKIFGVRIVMREDGQVEVSLRDMTNSFLHFHAGDRNWDASKLRLQMCSLKY